MKDLTYISIDLKSFFASVECVERGLDPFKTNLVVADVGKSKGTICLAITPAMKELGVKNRCRIYEIPKGIEYIAAKPQMKIYAEYSDRIFKIYNSFVADDDIVRYSIDEVFIDATQYLQRRNIDAKAFANELMNQVFNETGIRATAGIGPNIFLSKVALDIMAKHSPDFIGILDEETFKEKLWNHKPLTDFWMFGKGTAKTLERYGVYTLKELSQIDERFLYDKFGVYAKEIILRSKGLDDTVISDYKNLNPKTQSLSHSQVLLRDYSFSEAKIIVKEMFNSICEELYSKGKVTDSFGLIVNYSNEENKPAKGKINTNSPTNYASAIMPKVIKLYEETVDDTLAIRKITVICNNIRDAKTENGQISFFENEDTAEEKNSNERIQSAVKLMKEKYGKNAVLKGIDLNKEATLMERNLFK